MDERGGSFGLFVLGNTRWPTPSLSGSRCQPFQFTEGFVHISVVGHLGVSILCGNGALKANAASTRMGNSGIRG